MRERAGRGHPDGLNLPGAAALCLVCWGMQSKATSVAQYLAELPPERRPAIATVRKIILDNIDSDVEEVMQYGMIGYVVPHRVYPPGYHCNPAQPLPLAGLASQKQHMALYVMSTYNKPGEEGWLRGRFARAGKKLDMGKCCIRFKKLEDLPLDVIGELFRRVPTRAYIESYEAALGARAGRAKRASPKAPARKPAKTKPGKTAKTATGRPAKKVTKRATKATARRTRAR